MTHGTEDAPPVTQKEHGGCEQGTAVTIQFSKMRVRKRTLAVVFAVALASCTAGDGTGLDAGGRPLPPVPPPNDDFQQIQATIFTPICSTCHAGANAPRGLRLD